MTELQQQLIFILGRRLFGSDENTTIIKAGERLSAEDWEALLQEARKQTVFSIVYAWVKENIPEKIPTEKREEYDQFALIGLTTNIRNRFDHFELHRILASQGIPYVILKGMASARYYPEPAERAMGDVDFLVAEEQVERVAALLEADGFTKIHDTEKHEFHWAYQRDNTELELHWAPPGVPNENGDIVRTYLSDLLDQATQVEEADGTWVAPSTFHHGMILLLHTASHLTSSGVGLRHLCDWLVFENSLTDEKFQVMFEEPLKRCGLWSFAQTLSQIGVDWFGCSPRTWCAEADKDLCATLLEDILTGGNFGRKDAWRPKEMKLIRNVATRRIKTGNMWSNAAVSVWEKAKREYPFFRRVPVLLPIGFLMECVRYFVDVLSGRKKNVFRKSVLSAAEQRQQIYAKLQLFEHD